MGSFHSFAQTLEKKIRQEIEKEFSKEETSSSSSDVPSETWTRLVGEMGPIHFNSNQRATIYHRHRPPAKPRPAHKMNSVQQEAWSFFQAHLEVPLAPNFSRADLKRAFRLLALRFHPDHGGSCHQIQALLRARQQLETLFL